MQWSGYDYLESGKAHTYIVLQYSWWAWSSFVDILATLWDKYWRRWVQSAFLHMFLGISLKPKPSRKAPVTKPKVFEHAMAKPKIPWTLPADNNLSYESETRIQMNPSPNKDRKKDWTRETKCLSRDVQGSSLKLDRFQEKFNCGWLFVPLQYNQSNHICAPDADTY